jgi:hypothetical protein
VTGRRGDVEFRGQCAVGDASVRVQQAQNSAVEVVETGRLKILRRSLDGWRHFRYFYGHYPILQLCLQAL